MLAGRASSVAAWLSSVVCDRGMKPCARTCASYLGPRAPRRPPELCHLICRALPSGASGDASKGPEKNPHDCDRQLESQHRDVASSCSRCAHVSQFWSRLTVSPPLPQEEETSLHLFRKKNQKNHIITIHVKMNQNTVTNWRTICCTSASAELIKADFI